MKEESELSLAASQASTLSQSCPPRGSYLITCLLTLSAKKHSKKMTLTRALPANGLSALQAGELVSGIKTGLHRTELLTRALGREGGGYSLLLHLPFPHVSKAARMLHLPDGKREVSERAPCAQTTCVFRGAGPEGPLILVFCSVWEHTGRRHKVQKKKIFNKTLVSKILDTDSLPEQRWTSSTLLLQGHMRITALSWHSGMRKEKNPRYL